MSPTKRTLLGPTVSTPADRSDPEAAERPPGSASPTADAAANCKTFRLEWPTDADFSGILFLHTLVHLIALFSEPNRVAVQTFPATRFASGRKSSSNFTLRLAGQSRNLFPKYGIIQHLWRDCAYKKPNRGFWHWHTTVGACQAAWMR